MVRRKSAYVALGSLLWIFVCTACGGGGGGGGGSGGECTFQRMDTDGDTIDDCTEGRGAAVEPNADGDEWPDWRDRDADGDGIPDADEAGDADLSTPPVDTDGDGVPDYLDPDADGDGVPDAAESTSDTDQDGTPDYRDPDSDGDTILDAEEGQLDSDHDGLPNALDLDSDGDGIPDAIEAGDDDPSTPPVDTDGDGRPDFLDLDSDGDFVPDAEEDLNGNGKVDAPCADPAAGMCESSPTSKDTDGDGTPDLVERIAGVDPADPASQIPADDFFFVLPYQGPAQSATFDFSTTVRQADVFISMDTTGSFQEEIDAVRASLDSVIIPGVQAAIPNAAFGVGRFEDFPLEPFGYPGDRPYELLQPITEDPALIAAGVDALPPAEGGNDKPEAGMEALYQWATGAGLPDFGYPPFGGSGIGGVDFRRDSLPIIIQITDARSHRPEEYVPTGLAPFGDAVHSRDETVAALEAIGARVIGVNSLENAGTPDDPADELTDLALSTHAVIPPDASGQCATGIGGSAKAPVDPGSGPVCPLVFDVARDGTGLGQTIVDAITRLASYGTLDISTELTGYDTDVLGSPLPPGITSDQLVTAVTAVGSDPPGAIIRNNVFVGITPGTTVTFEVQAQNLVLEPRSDADYVLQVEIRVMGDGVTLLDTRKVYIVVPRDVGAVDIP